MKIITYNINGIRARMEQFLTFLAAEQPDIIGLQEIKVDNPLFPGEEIEKQGYKIIKNGQKGHYGVAILSKKPPVYSQLGFEKNKEEDQKRIIYSIFETKIGNIILINGYFPQGESRHHTIKFPYKMKFYDSLMRTLNTLKPEDHVIVMGDLNISPEDKDVGIGEKNAKRWLQTGKCSFLPEERERIQEIREWGLFDTYRELYPTVDDIFTWFDYRSKGFDVEPKRGLRIDHIWATKSLLQYCKNVVIDYKLRGGVKPSDHCPVIANFNFS